MLDIPTSFLIGEPVKSIGYVRARRLQCNKRAVWGNYNNTLESYCRRHNILAKIHRIQTNACFMSPSVYRSSMNAVDRVLGEGMIHAEKKCRKIRAGVVPFSPILATAGLFINLWGLVVRHHKGSNINSRRIRRIADKCKIPRALACSLEEAQEQKKAEQDYKRLKKSAQRLQLDFL